MIDELELAFDERTEKGRHRRGYRKKQARREAGGGGGRGKTVAALLVTFLLLGVLGGGLWYGFDRVQGLFGAPDYSGSGAGQAQIQIKPGESLTEIGNSLVRAGVVKSAAAFVDEAGANSRSTNIQPGFYNLRKQMSAESALAMLLEVANKVANTITIPEGRTAKQTYKLLSEKTKIPVKDFEAAAKDPLALGVPEFWFNRTDGKKTRPSIEGFLFPDTYEFDPNPTAEQVLKTMVGHFLAVAEELDFVKTVESERGGVSPYEALIVASLAQAEAGTKADLGKVARVAYNRAYSGTFPCSCLEMDVTVNYYLELSGKATKRSGDMTPEELDDPKNPYNRKLRGMVPTPINNPGKEALQGAMDPPAGKWLFFVAIDKQGNSAFAETNDEHLRNIQKACRNGIPLC
ncbi:UPF0755 protein [Micromonospora pattaloongensis]|uniref:Endolytic murein transglycosylase n=1 Tax=Micromonospora pattaloongensis TaxID=405436 RepID=A0A1H3S4A7_9ACTN|nr:endolytic transglycosylase MltG [Micromonospora pattaloongensis]SDZ32650.1 UPF0755 protein [Micromonospora pattaloongensis]